MVYKKLIINNQCAKCGSTLDDFSLRLCENCKKEIFELIENIINLQPEQKRKIDQFGMDLDSIINHREF